VDFENAVYSLPLYILAQIFPKAWRADAPNFELAGEASGNDGVTLLHAGSDLGLLGRE